MTKVIMISFHPSMHLDESYYIGAALKILGGDLFLMNHSFDKPIMQAIWPIPGIVIAGKNIIGFKLSGWIAAILSFVFLAKLPLFDNDKLKRFCFLILLLVVFLLPFNIPYFASSMGEPFLLFCFSLFIFNYLKFLRTNSFKFEKWAYIYFALACITKQSAIMWAPMFLPLIIYKWRENRKVLSFFITFWRSTWFLWILVLVFQLTNKSKLAAILWFTHLSKQHTNTFSNKMSFWLNNLIDIWGSPILASLIYIIVIAYTGHVLAKVYFLYRSSKDHFFKLPFDLNDYRLEFLLVVLPVWLHLIGIPLSNAPLYDRYLFILIPQIVLLLAFILRRLNSKYTVGFISFVLILTAAFQYNKTPSPLYELTKKGEHVLIINDLLDSESLLHSPFKWSYYPIEFPFSLTSCLGTKCLKEYRGGESNFAKQYYVDRDLQLKRVPKWSFEDIETEIVSRNIQLDETLVHYIKKKLRFPKDFKVQSFKTLGKYNKTNSAISYDSNLNTFDLVLGDDKSKINLIFSPIISVSNHEQNDFIKNQNIVSVIVHDVVVDLSSNLQINLTDISRVIWDGKIVELFPLRYQLNHHSQDIIGINYDKDKLLTVYINEKKNE